MLPSCSIDFRLIISNFCNEKDLSQGTDSRLVDILKYHCFSLSYLNFILALVRNEVASGSIPLSSTIFLNKINILEDGVGFKF
jgi:hypothetical protein